MQVKGFFFDEDVDRDGSLTEAGVFVAAERCGQMVQIRS